MAAARGTGDIRGFLSTMAPALSQFNLDDKAIWLRSLVVNDQSRRRKG
jgi:hypothetical protein